MKKKIITAGLLLFVGVSLFVAVADVQDGKVTRWKNLEDVWNYTDDKAAFRSFMNESWATFREAKS